MNKSSEQFLEEARPLPEGIMDWWDFCQKNSKYLSSIPTFQEFKQDQFNFIKINLNS